MKLFIEDAAEEEEVESSLYFLVILLHKYSI